MATITSLGWFVQELILEFLLSQQFSSQDQLRHLQCLQLRWRLRIWQTYLCPTQLLLRIPDLLVLRRLFLISWISHTRALRICQTRALITALIPTCSLPQVLPAWQQVKISALARGPELTSALPPEKRRGLQTIRVDNNCPWIQTHRFKMRLPATPLLPRKTQYWTQSTPQVLL